MMAEFSDTSASITTQVPDSTANASKVSGINVPELKIDFSSFTSVLGSLADQEPSDQAVTQKALDTEKSEAPAGLRGTISPEKNPGGYKSVLAPMLGDKGNSKVWTPVYAAKKLMTDFGLSAAQAAGIMGNFAFESNNFKSLQEKNPLVPRSKGGYGWAQWTGPRRRMFETFAKNAGQEPSSGEANYAFTSFELKGPYSRALNAVKNTDDPAQAAETFMNLYEAPAGSKFSKHPGNPHLDIRQQKAQEIYGQLTYMS